MGYHRNRYPDNLPCPVHGLPLRARFGSGRIGAARCGNHCGFNDLTSRTDKSDACHTCFRSPFHTGACEFTGPCLTNRVLSRVIAVVGPTDAPGRPDPQALGFDPPGAIPAALPRSTPGPQTGLARAAVSKSSSKASGTAGDEDRRLGPVGRYSAPVTQSSEAP
jgi:hypothetical protein